MWNDYEIEEYDKKPKSLMVIFSTFFNDMWEYVKNAVMRKL